MKKLQKQKSIITLEKNIILYKYIHKYNTIHKYKYKYKYIYINISDLNDLKGIIENI